MSQLGLGMTTMTQETRGSRKRRGGVAVLIAAGVLLGLVAVVVIVFLRLFSTTPDYTGNGHGEVVVQIRIGDNLDQIGQILAKADVVRSASTFVGVASADPNGQDIQPGSYKMHFQMSATA